ncbi:MAG: DUF5117 domain-containing protein, partial [Cyclobacteriaceae bacterium]
MNRILLLLAMFTSLSLLAQKKNQDTPPATPAASSPIEAKVAGLKKFPGFIEFYYDEKQDKIYLLIEKFDTELIYVESITAGVGSNDIGLDRNQLGAERIVKFERRGPKVLLTQPNYFYRAISNNPAEVKAVQESFATSVLWGFTIAAEENGKVLVDASDFLMQDAHDVIGTLKSAQQGSYSIDKTRSAFYLPRTKNFPQNSEFETTLTFTGQPSGGYIRSVTPTPSAVTVREHHSFVQLPDGNFKPRKFD